MKKIFVILLMLCLFGCTEKKSTEVKMTTEEEVLSVAINYVVDLRKEFVGKVELLYIENSILSTIVYYNKDRYLNIIPTDLLKNYLNSFEKYGKNLRDDKTEELLKNLELNYKYVKKDASTCIRNWYKDNGIDRSDITRYEKEKHNLFKKCSINKPSITIAHAPAFNDEKDLALVEVGFFYSEGELSDPQKPYLSGTSVIVLRKIRGQWAVIFQDDMYFGEKVLGPS